MTDRELRLQIRKLIHKKQIPWKEGRHMFLDLYLRAKARIALERAAAIGKKVLSNGDLKTSNIIIARY